MILFRSEVGPDVMMFDEVAQRMMELMGKEKATRGVVTPAEMPAIVARLRAAIERDKARTRAVPESAGDAADDSEGPPPVGLTQRALPLIELLEISLARQKPVTWGV